MRVGQNILLLKFYRLQTEILAISNVWATNLRSTFPKLAVDLNLVVNLKSFGAFHPSTFKKIWEVKKTPPIVVSAFKSL